MNNGKKNKIEVKKRSIPYYTDDGYNEDAKTNAENLLEALLCR